MGREEDAGPDGGGNIARRQKVGFDTGIVQALHNAGISVAYHDTALRQVWSELAPHTWSDRDGVAESLSPEETDRLASARAEVLETGRQSRLELRLAADDGVRWFDTWIDADRGADGAIRGLVTTTVEITDQKRREQSLRALLREVSHRSRNLLAIIQSIATQTGRHSATIGEFITRFGGRLQSLASSQDLVTSSNWRGADLHELIAGQVLRYASDPVRSVHIEGYNPYLNPNATLHVGLALHELAVNSMSYGALSRPAGQVTIGARPIGDGPLAGGLDLEWKETAPGMAEFDAKRFGSVTLERVVPSAVAGTASLEIADGVLSYRLMVPAASLEVE